VSAEGEDGGWLEGEKREKGGAKVLRAGGRGGKERGRGKKKEGCRPAVGPHPKKSISNPIDNVARANGFKKKKKLKKITYLYV
jgi:hypothetical protein